MRFGTKSLPVPDASVTSVHAHQKTPRVLVYPTEPTRGRLLLLLLFIYMCDMRQLIIIVTTEAVHVVLLLVLYHGRPHLFVETDNTLDLRN